MDNSILLHEYRLHNQLNISSARLCDTLLSAAPTLRAGYSPRFSVAVSVSVFLQCPVLAVLPEAAAAAASA